MISREIISKIEQLPEDNSLRILYTKSISDEKLKPQEIVGTALSLKNKQVHPENLSQGLRLTLTENLLRRQIRFWEGIDNIDKEINENDFGHPTLSGIENLDWSFLEPNKDQE